VLIADYKTDRALPGDLAAVPERYTGQLALYRAILGRVYPGKTIRAALIFTAGPTVIEIPGAVLDAALAKALAR
jgi:ATP-dependent helicase/nuclease subunit A